MCWYVLERYVYCITSRSHLTKDFQKESLSMGEHPALPVQPSFLPCTYQSSFLHHPAGILSGGAGEDCVERIQDRHFPSFTRWFLWVLPPFLLFVVLSSQSCRLAKGGAICFFFLSKKSKVARLLLPPSLLQQPSFLAAAKPAQKLLTLLVHAKPLAEEEEGSCSNHCCKAVMLSC